MEDISQLHSLHSFPMEFPALIPFLPQCCIKVELFRQAFDEADTHPPQHCVVLWLATVFKYCVSPCIPHHHPHWTSRDKGPHGRSGGSSKRGQTIKPAQGEPREPAVLPRLSDTALLTQLPLCFGGIPMPRGGGRSRTIRQLLPQICKRRLSAP